MTNAAELLLRYMVTQKTLLSSMKLKDVLDAACLQLADLAGGARVAILLSDNENLRFKLMASRGYSDATVETLGILPFAADSILKEVVQTRKPAQVESIESAPDVSAVMMRREGSVTQVGLPLIASNLLVGAAFLDLPESLTPDRLDLMASAAEVVAQALASAILYGRVEYERDRLDTLYKTSCSLGGSALEVSEVLKIAADTALVLANTPNCAILLCDADRNEFTLAALKGLDGNSLNEFDLSLSGTAASRCLKARKSEYLAQTSAMGGLPRVMGGSDVGSCVALPLICRDEPLGVLMVFSTEARAFHREQVELLESLAAQTSAALYVALRHETAAAMSIQDAHTALFNRWHFDQALNREVERSARHERELVLLLVDLDHLGQINVHLGQAKGDEAIKHVARIIKAQLRDIDIPCRYGGQEFAVLLPDTKAEAGKDVAERLRKKVQAATASGIGTVTVSIGLAAFPQNAGSADTLLKVCEQALDIAKFEGRDRLKVAETGQSATGPIAWEELARQAKLAVVAERQSKLQSKLSVNPEYAAWLRAQPTLTGVRRTGEVKRPDK